MTKHFLASAAISALLMTPAVAQDADTVLATVNGNDITLGHIIVATSQLPEQYQSLPDDVLLNGLLDQLIQQELVATDLGDDLTPYMATAVENENRALLAALALDGIASAEITDDELQAAYDEQFASEDPAVEFNASHILVETEEAAQALVDELEAGADFAELAQEHSTGPSGPNGGLLGWFSAGMMVPTFEAAVMDLEVGEVSAPTETQFGWHVIILNETRDQAAPEMAVVRDELEEALRRNRVDTHIEALTEAAEIDRAEVSVDPMLIRNVDLLAN